MITSLLLCTAVHFTQWDFEHPWNSNQLITSDVSTRLQTAEKLKPLFKAQSLSVLI